MTDSKLLTPSQIRYICVTYRLCKEGSIHSVEIASVLGLSRPSVHNMTKVLSERGLICKASYGSVYLSEEGKTVAKKYDEYYNNVFPLLKELGIEEKEADILIYTMLATLSEDSLENLTNKAKSSKIYDDNK